MRENIEKCPQLIELYIFTKNIELSSYIVFFDVFGVFDLLCGNVCIYVYVYLYTLNDKFGMRNMRIRTVGH